MEIRVDDNGRTITPGGNAWSSCSGTTLRTEVSGIPRFTNAHRYNGLTIPGIIMMLFSDNQDYSARRRQPSQRWSNKSLAKMKQEDRCASVEKSDSGIPIFLAVVLYRTVQATCCVRYSALFVYSRR